MKKVLRISLVCIIIFSMVITSAYAVPGKNNGNGNGNGKGNGNFNNIKKITTQSSFSDLGNYGWAARYIYKMSKKNIIKGEGNGKFSPARAAKEIETIILCLRSMGWEEDLIDDVQLPKGYKGKKPDTWMTPYINLALEKGLITKAELDSFNSNKPSTRSKTAMYIVRTLDLEEDAQNHMDEILDFDDFSAIPDEHIGYVYVVNNLGLMVGYHNNFHPNKPINRAELAVLLSRVDDIVDTDISYTVKGKIERISDDTIKLEVDGDDEKFDLSDDLTVFINDEEKTLKDLDLGMIATLEIKDDLVINIEVNDEEDDSKIFVRYKGILEDITRDDDEIKNIDVTLDSSRTSDTFELAENAVISIEGGSDELEDKYISCSTVIVVGNDNLIYKIKVYLEKIEGTLTEIIEEDDEITGVKVLTDDSLSPEIYDFVDDTIICVNNEPEELNDTLIGCDVKLTLYGDETIGRLNVEDTNIIYTINGVINNIADNQITLDVDGENEEFELYNNLTVFINDDEKTFEDLEVGMIATLKIKNDLVIRIIATEEDDEVVFIRYEGILKDIIRDDEEITSIDIKLSSLTTYDNYEFADNPIIKIEGEKDDLEDKYIGCNILVTIGSDNKIYKLEVNLGTIEGTIIGIVEEDDDFIGITLVNDYSLNKQIFYFSDDVLICIDGDSIELEDSHIGSDVKLTLLGDNTVSKLEIIE